MREFREAHKGEFEEMRGKFGDRGRPPRGEGKPAPKADGDQMAPPPPPPKEGAPADAKRYANTLFGMQATGGSSAMANVLLAKMLKNGQSVAPQAVSPLAAPLPNAAKRPGA